MANDDDRPVEDVTQGGQARETGQRPSGAQAPATDVHAYIGRQLRAVYDDVANQPVPDRFLELMRRLETAKAES